MTITKEEATTKCSDQSESLCVTTIGVKSKIRVARSSWTGHDNDGKNILHIHILISLIIILCNVHFSVLFANKC